MLCLYHFAAYNHFLQLGFFRNAYLFVDFFFVLSGFVIASAYHDRLSDLRSLGAFIIARFGRLWPLHAFILVAWVATEVFLFGLARAGFYNGAVFSGVNAPWTLPANLLFLNAFGLIGFMSWNYPSWSIGAEFYTYAVFALGALLLGRRWKLCAALIAAFIGLCLVALIAPMKIDLVENGGFLRCVYGFFIGVAVFHLRRRTKDPDAKPFAALEIALALASIVIVSVIERSPWTLAAPVFFGAIVYVYSYEKGLVTKALRRPVFQTLGELSYSIYMVHALIAAWFGYAFMALEKFNGALFRRDLASHFIKGDVLGAYYFGNVWLMDVVTIVFLLAVVAASFLTFRFVEAPSRDYFKNLAQRFRRAATLTGPA